MAGFSVTESSLYFGPSLEANVLIHTVLMHAFSDRGTVVLSSINFSLLTEITCAFLLSLTWISPDVDSASAPLTLEYCT